MVTISLVNKIKSYVEFIGQAFPVSGVRQLTKGTLVDPAIVYLIGWVLNTKNVAINGCEARFKVRTHSEFEHFSAPLEHERPMLKHVLETVDENDTFYDIGANIGLYSCLVGNSSVPQPVIVSFEPFPPNVERLKENIELNDVSARVEEIALSNKSGLSQFRIDQRNVAGSGRGQLVNDGEETLKIHVKKGDELEGLPEPTIVKIDVEGNEQEVIKGMKSTLTESVDHVYCEWHRKKARNVRSMLEELEFKVDTIYKDENRTFLHGQKSQ